MIMSLWNAIDRRFRKSEYSGAVAFLEERLAKEKTRSGFITRLA
jgi:hypothetical protein